MQKYSQNGDFAKANLSKCHVGEVLLMQSFCLLKNDTKKKKC